MGTRVPTLREGTLLEAKEQAADIASLNSPQCYQRGRSRHVRRNSFIHVYLLTSFTNKIPFQKEQLCSKGLGLWYGLLRLNEYHNSVVFDAPHCLIDLIIIPLELPLRSQLHVSTYNAMSVRFIPKKKNPQTY